MTTPAPQKEAMVILLDVGKSMGLHSNEVFQDCKKAVELMIKMKIRATPKDELGIVLVGSQNTENELNNEDEDEYKNIQVLCPISNVSLDMSRELSEVTVEPNNKPSQLIDALQVAADMIKARTRTLKYKRRVFIITDAGDTMKTKNAEKALAALKKMGATINVIGVNFKQDYFDQENKMDQSDDDELPTKDKNELFWHSECSKMQGSVVSLQDAIGQLGLFRSKKVRETTTYRGHLEIGDELKIKVWIYKKTDSTKLPAANRLSKISLNSEATKDAKIKIDRTYFATEDPDLEVPLDKRVKAYKYGKNLVPFNEADDKMLSYHATKCILLLGFTDEKNVPRHYLMSETYAMYAQPDDANAYTALSALVRALAELEKVAIIRLVMRDGNSEPKMGLLYPCIKPDLNFFYFNTLPYAEDIRSYPFASFKNVQLSESQLNAAQELIQSMDMMTVEKDEEEDTFVESLKTSHVYNPINQHFYDCLHHRAVNPQDSELPPVDPQILKYCYPESSLSSFYSELIKSSAESLSNFCNEFPLKEEPTKTAAKKRKYWFAVEDQSLSLASYGVQQEQEEQEQEAVLEKPVDEELVRAAKRLKEDVERMSEEELRQLASEKGGAAFDALLGDRAEKIGTVNPVRDFKDMLKRRDVDMVDKAIQEIQLIVTKLIKDSIGDQYYSKAYDCVVELRSGCLKEEEVGKFNTFMNQLKLQFSTGKRSEFWDNYLVKNKVSLITEDESASSSVTGQEAKDFLKPTEIEKPDVVQEVEEETDGDDMFGDLE
ncbi:X-ray repair cross-complementing protein [Acrasis kona]|uniref:X-ray repair cross-complementing protein n=1 Tax=Acrasis kona TaxID=1008807 RepID=A0AAW2YLZ8_9EUKA